MLAHLTPDAKSAGWEPAITRIEDAGTAWRVFYDPMAFVDSGQPPAALAGNWPHLVSKDGGQPRLDEEYRQGALGC